MRERALYVLIFVIPELLIVSLSSKQFDRYGVGVLPFFALLVGLGVDQLVRWVRRRGVSARAVAATAFGTATATALFSLSVAPWGLAYFNPLLGGGRQAEKTLLVGWGEGLERFGHIIAKREKGHCDGVEVVAPNPYFTVAFPCGHITGIRQPDPDYVVVYINQRQRLSPSARALFAAATRRMRRITHLTVRGIDYGALYARR
jgi:hypothetical protein